MLDTFEMQQGGSQYRRLVGAFQPVFGATIFFGTDSQRQKALVVHQARFMNHPIPTDLEAAKALSSAPAALDLFTWLSYRRFTAKGEERIPIFGDCGLVHQIGSTDYARPRKFRERLERWLELVKALWPECPARINHDCESLIVNSAQAVLAEQGNKARCV